MSTARHPRARHFSSEGLFRSLRNFAELEERIASLESPQDRGDAFEVFAEVYLATQRLHQAEEIWPGNSLPITVAARLGLPLKDMGVDGVFRASDGSHHAYQVKFRRGRPALGWAELATFMGLSDRAVQRVVFTNCESLPEVMNERRGFVCVRGTDLDRLTASDFKIIEAWVLGEAISRQPKTPAPHQREALDSIASGLKSASRATVVMACGTGKTLVALWAAEEIGARRIIVLLPSLALVRQTLHEWLKESNWPALRFIAVCSDRTVMSGNDDGLRVHQSDLDFAVTTEADVVRDFMDSDFDGVKVVFSTYQSARVVAEAVGPPGFDFGVFDEAHKTTGVEGKAFSLALEDRNLPIAKRLFMTATPRHYDARKRDADGERKLVYSMDAPDTYGPIVHTLSFSEAARRGIVCHCKIIISVVTSDMINAELLRRGEVLVDGGSVHAGSVANQIALQKACETYSLKKVFSFHSSVSAAQDFTNDSPSSVSRHLPGFEVMHVSGAMPTARRERIMQSFRGADRAVIANARCLTEGVDVPAVDVVAFLSPRRSKVDIVQAAGRALRNSPGKSVGYVLLPLFVETSKDETIEQALVRTGFEEVWSVLSSLAEQDDALVDTIRQMREDLGRSGRFSDDKLRETVEVIGQTIDLEALRSAVAAQIVEYVGASWDERLGQLEAFSARHGHCRVPARWPENPALGLWVVNQRRVRKAGNLSPDRIARLDALGFEWGDSHEASTADRWEAKFAELKAFRIRHGHCLVPSRWPENPALGLWVVNQRRMRKAGKLSEARAARLKRLGVDVGEKVSPSQSEQWNTKLAELEAFRLRHGDCRVPYRWDENPTLGRWVAYQRHMRRAGKLSPDKVAQLDALGFMWDPPHVGIISTDEGKTSRRPDPIWAERLAQITAYRSAHGNCRVPFRWAENPELGRWVAYQRHARKTGKLPSYRIARLDALGFEWRDNTQGYKVDRWESKFAELEAFRIRHGHCRVPARWPESPALGIWVVRQRRMCKAGKISPDRIAKLDALNFDWLGAVGPH
jgi:superfamily II DNA or RNA helicase